MQHNRTFNELSIYERQVYIEHAQQYLRAEISELQIPFVTDACRREILNLAERCEMDRDFIEDRLSFVRSGL